MLKIALRTDDGTIGIIGINNENLRRMKAGMPLSIDLEEMTPPGSQMNQMIVHYAHTYEDVAKDLANDGIPIPDELHETAKKMDALIEREQQHSYFFSKQPLRKPPTAQA